MDPRTFLKPRTRHVTGPRLVSGDAAPDLNGIAFDQPTIVAFLRHVGCPFAEKTVRELVEIAGENPAAQCVAVSHGTPDNTAAWCEAVGVTDRIRVVDDPTAEAYARWGLGLTPLRHWLGRDSLRGVAKLSKEGIRNRHPSGTRWQSAGTFAVDSAGVIVWARVPQHGADLPFLKTALQVLIDARKR